MTLNPPLVRVEFVADIKLPRRGWHRPGLGNEGVTSMREERTAAASSQVCRQKKTCSKCDTEKALDDFPRTARRKDGRGVWCRACMSAYSKVWSQREPVKKRNRAASLARYHALPDHKKGRLGGAAQAREQRLRRVYGLTSGAYDAMLEAQGGVCAICEIAPGKTALRVDHDHACCPGERSCGACVRGLLCVRCNSQLHALEAGEWRDRAERYLQRDIDKLEAVT